MVGMRMKNWFARHFSFEGMYYHTCRYGESYVRPLVIVSLILALSIGYFTIIQIINIEQLDSKIIIQSLENSTKRSISALFPFFELENNELIDFFLRIVLLPMLGTLFIALRRNLERRFRH